MSDPTLPAAAGARRVLVTGGASGIGESAVRACLKRGARVAALDRSLIEPDPWDPVHSERWRGFQCDVADEDQVSASTGEAIAWLGGLDAVLHVAGIVGDNRSDADTLERKAWDAVLDVNLTGAWLVAKHCLPALADGGGALVLTGSGAGVHNAHSSVAYAASKGGLNGLAITLEERWRRRGVSVIAVLPGSVDTPLLRRVNPGGDASRARQKSEHMMVESDEVGELLAFLAHPEASAVRGPVRTW